MGRPPTAGQLLREYRRYRFAESDWLDARAATDMLLDGLTPDDGTPYARRALHAAMGVSYSRPFTDNEGLGMLDRGKWAPDDETLRVHHRALIELRDKHWAHTNLASGYRNVEFVEGIWIMRWTEIEPEALHEVKLMLDAQTARARAKATAALLLYEEAVEREDGASPPHYSA